MKTITVNFIMRNNNIFTEDICKNICKALNIAKMQCNYRFTAIHWIVNNCNSINDILDVINDATKSIIYNSNPDIQQDIVPKSDNNTINILNEFKNETINNICIGIGVYVSDRASNIKAITEYIKNNDIKYRVIYKDEIDIATGRSVFSYLYDNEIHQLDEKHIKEICSYCFKNNNYNFLYDIILRIYGVKVTKKFKKFLSESYYGEDYYGAINAMRLMNCGIKDTNIIINNNLSGCYVQDKDEFAAEGTNGYVNEWESIERITNWQDFADPFTDEEHNAIEETDNIQRTKNNEPVFFDSNIYPFLKDVVETIGQVQAISKFEHFYYSSGKYFLSDISNIYAQYKRNKNTCTCLLTRDMLKGNDVTKIYDNIVKANNSFIISAKESNILYSNAEKSLEKTYGTVKFQLPVNESELKSIGDKLHICVGSYGRDCYTKRCTVVSITDNNQYIGCIEVNNNTIIQVKGFANGVLPLQYVKVFDKWVKDCDIYINPLADDIQNIFISYHIDINGNEDSVKRDLVDEKTRANGKYIDYKKFKNSILKVYKDCHSNFI